MISLASALAATSSAGEPLPPVWPELVLAGVEFRRGNLTLVAAGPGGNKSVLAMNLALRARVPALYVSADTDQQTTGLRVAALLSGDSIGVVEAGMKNGDVARYHAYIDDIDWCRWSFEPQPTVDDVREEVEAFGHVFGQYPELIVIDNLSNVYSDEDDNTAARHNVEAFNILARESGACVLVLHHLVGEYESGDKPPPLNALIGKVGKMPSMVLTLFRGYSGDLGVCIVKNRWGPADGRGHQRVFLPLRSDKARIG